MELLNFIGPWACSALFFVGPLAFAWWLSDGFADIEISSDNTRVCVGFNPHTNRTGLVVISNVTNGPVAYIS